MSEGRVREISAIANARAQPGVKPATAGGDRSNRLHAQKALLEYLVCGRING